MRQHETEQQADTQHATAVHKPLHNNGALFVIQLEIGGIDLLLGDNQLIFQLLVLVFQRVDDVIAARDFFCMSAVRWFQVVSMLFSLSVRVFT